MRPCHRSGAGAVPVGGVLLLARAEVVPYGVRENAGDQGRFARSRDAGDGGEDAEREGRVQAAQIVQGGPAEGECARGAAHRALGGRCGVEEEPAGGGVGGVRERGDGAAVQHLSAVFPGLRADVHDPVGAAHHVHVVLDDEQRVARFLEPAQHREQGLRVGGVETGGRLVQDVDDAEEAGAQLGGEPQPLEFAGGQGGRGPVHAQIAQAEFGEDIDTGHQVAGQHRRHLVVRPPGGGPQQLCEGAQRAAREGGDVMALEGDGQRLRAQPPSVAHRAGLGDHEPLDAPPQRLALGVGEGVQHIAFGAHVLALVGALDPAHVADRVHGDDRLFVREQDPVPVGLRELAPGPVDVVPEGGEDVAEVLALPGARPGGDGTLAEGQRGVGDQ